MKPPARDTIEVVFKGFSERRFSAAGAEIFGRVGRADRALLLLHGHPQSHVMW